MVTPTDKADMEWEALIADAGAEVEPDTYMKPGEIITRPSEEVPFAQRVNSLEYKGYVKVWDRVTGVMSLQPRWLLWQTMQKLRPDGTRVFTLTDPQIPQPHGQDLKCPLHPESPEHARLVSMGFKECRKQHIPHLDGLRRHIRKSHSRVWEVLEQEREERIRQEDRDLQRETLRVMTQAVGGNQVRDLPEPAVTASGAPTQVLTVQHMKKADGLCICGWRSQGKKRQARETSLRRHIETAD